MKKKKYKNKKNYLNNTNKRFNIISFFIILSFSFIIFDLFYLNILNGYYYKHLLKEKTRDIVEGVSAPRGRIYDKNNNLLVDNISVKTIYYTKKKNISKEEEIDLAYLVSSKIDLEYEKILEINLKEFWLVLNEDLANDLITEKEYEDLSNRKLTDKDIYNFKIDRITTYMLNKFNDEDKKAAYLYYLMNKGYYYDEKIIKENCNDKEYAYISENSDNLFGFNTKLTWERVYLYKDVFKSILGSVSNISAEEKDVYLDKGYDLTDLVGVSGIELQYEDILKGEKAKYKIMDDNSLELISEGKKGNDIVLTIDIDVQKDLENILKEEIKKTKKEPNAEFYNRSFVVVQEPKTGAIIAMSGKQIVNNDIYDFTPGIMTSSVTPGSVVKGASIIVGYNAKVIDIGTKMTDACIKLANMPRKCSWRTLGVVNDLDALRLSSNVYQYKTAMKVGKFNYSYDKKLSLDLNAYNLYRGTFYQFGMGVETGIDYPIEHVGVRGKSTNAGLLIDFAIGQYDTYTPLQLSQYITTIANKGNRVKPHLLKSILGNNNDILYEVSPVVLNKVDTKDKYMNRVREGFRLVLRSGTGVGYMGKAPNPSGKTGTSESFVDVDGDGYVDHETISNNFLGYAPSDNPIMSIAVVSPDVQNPKRGEYKSRVTKRLASRVSNMFFSYYDANGKRK